MYANLILHDPERILTIGNHDLISELEKDIIYGDGTFDKAPKNDFI